MDDTATVAQASVSVLQSAPEKPDAHEQVWPAPVVLSVLQGRAQPGVVVTDEEVRAAQRFAFAKLNLVVEPGGAAALAAALSGKVPVDADTVIMVTGGNTDAASFAKTLNA